MSLKPIPAPLRLVPTARAEREMLSAVRDCVETLCADAGHEKDRAKALIKLLALTTDFRTSEDDRGDLADAALSQAFCHTDQFKSMLQAEVDALIPGMKRRAS